MKNLSRRDFFKHLTDSVTDTIDAEKLKEVFHEPLSVTDWIPLVQLSEMTPGNVLPFQFGELRGFLHSDESGLYAILNDSRYAALRATSQGVLEINIKEKWARGQILSHATGTAVFSE